AVDTKRHVLDCYICESREYVCDRLLDRTLRTIVIFNRRAEMQRDGEHACMFAGTVVVQDGWLFGVRTKLESGFGAVRLVHAALQSLRAETDLAQHRGRDFRVDWLAVMRCAGKRDLTIVESKSIGGAGKQQRQCLKRFCGRPQEGDVVWSTE